MFHWPWARPVVTTAARKEELLRSIIDCFPEEEPYVLGGRFSWFLLPGEKEARPLDLVYLDLGIIFQTREEEPDVTACAYLEEFTRENELWLIQLSVTTNPDPDKLKDLIKALLFKNEFNPEELARMQSLRDNISP